MMKLYLSHKYFDSSYFYFFFSAMSDETITKLPKLRLLNQ